MKQMALEYNKPMSTDEKQRQKQTNTGAINILVRFIFLNGSRIAHYNLTSKRNTFNYEMQNVIIQ